MMTFEGVGRAGAPLIVEGRADARPTTHRRAVFWLTLSVWLGSFALSTIRDLADPPSDLWLMTEIRLVFAALGGLLCLPLLLFLDSIRRFSFGVRATLALAPVAVLAIAYTQASLFAQNWLQPSAIAPSAGWQFYNTVYWSLFFLVWMALYLALSYSRQIASQAHTARELEYLAHDAEVRALRYQVDPHFLFNSLNSISALVISGQSFEAETMLRNLSRFYRATIALDPTNDIPLREELELQQLFLDVEQVRFPDMTVQIVVSEEAAAVSIPALLLQPLVENAIKHAVARRQEPTTITIRARVAARELVIEIENDDAGRPPLGGGSGLGLRNTRERLKARYGNASSMAASSRPENRFAVHLGLPIGEAP